MPFRNRLLAVGLAALLAGCVNLQAISTYSESAAGVVGSTDAAKRWRDSDQRLREQRLDGDVCPIGYTGRLPQAQFDAAYEDAAKLHQAMSAYFIALSELASDKLPDVAKTAATSLEGIKGAGVKVSAEEEAAVKGIFALLHRGLDAYRHKKLRELMTSSHGDVARVLGLMQKLADVYAEGVRGERIQAVNFVKCEIGQSDLADKYLGRRELARVQKDYDTDLKAIATYKAALQKLADDHDKIRDALAMDRDAMARTLKAIAATAKALDKAHDAVSKL
ncbi:hypothetical protein [Roseateles sp. MS654]|uniref:hypothetical protein n=1 Tax=Roseateles sp. MS654 TaxID=3412685 RepID=UPI003C2BAA70